ncbi:MAG: hypothetical protein ACPGUY_09510, partial [Akkermansiaceae bacterium]
VAVRPTLDAAELEDAVDSVYYRARRILLPWISYVLGGADPSRVVHVYAMSNIAAWFILAALLWRLFPVSGWREEVGWTGILFSSGAILSVRLALTDLPALVFLTGAMLMRARSGWMASLFGLAALTRETLVLAAVTLLPLQWRDVSQWKRAIWTGLIVVLPLGLWFGYVSAQAGQVEPGLHNFAWPGLMLGRKLLEAVNDIFNDTPIWMAITNGFTIISLVAQGAWLLVHRKWENVWWRLGAIYALLMLSLSWVVWEGYPGAAPRVLLPLTLAFNVLAVRRRAGLGWLLTGNLSVLCAITILFPVPQDHQEVSADRSFVADYAAGWHPMERYRDKHWAWSAEKAEIAIRFEQGYDHEVSVKLQLRGIDARNLEIRSEGQVLWNGQAPLELEWVTLRPMPVKNERLLLEITSPSPPLLLEGDQRGLGFAVYDLEIVPILDQK